ncbi:YfaZ family outer membrane protein [Litoribrevibacter euphylliae]|uniref:YfaZ family outer membrane protein n=1 Tax=Litoribrevibacter euphylliae TaxID=1834034 RepID=A0ABV7HGH8_9GAMM
MNALFSKTYSSSLTLALTCATAFVSSSALAGEFEIQLSNSSVYAEASSPDSTPMQFSAGYLYHEESRNVINLDMHAQNQSSVQGNDTHVGVGLRGIGYHEHNTDGLGLALGGFGEIELNRVPGLSVGGSLHYSPDILTFSDVDDFLWFEAYTGYSVIPNADVQFGYRYIKADVDGGKNGSVESTGFVGLRFQF